MLGKTVHLIVYDDEKFPCDLLTKRSCPTCSYFATETLIDWVSEKPLKIETTTYSSEFVTP